MQQAAGFCRAYAFAFPCRPLFELLAVGNCRATMDQTGLQTEHHNHHHDHFILVIVILVLIAVEPWKSSRAEMLLLARS